jgi:hypothetical protein
MTEERKFAIMFAATILAARRLIDLDPDKPNMAKGFFVDRAIEDAAFILERIEGACADSAATLTCALSSGGCIA